MQKRTTAYRCFFIILTALSITFSVMAQPRQAPVPRLIHQGGRHALLVDNEPFFMLGGQAHNSSAWPGMMPQVWEAAERMHLNTLEVPLYWEQIEPTEGQFNFSLVDVLLQQARLHNVRLVLLWFGTWKNGSNHYVPRWMKAAPALYPNITGKNGKPVDSPSPHSAAALAADKKAFAAVMRYLKKADGQRTVIMVQVENEPGSWGSVRDYSPTAQALFNGPVPAELLTPKILKTLNTSATTKTNWPDVFGANADEFFHAWSIAKYIGEVAAAGKAEYALPLYVNAALRDPLTNPPPTQYESGGPTDNVLAIWQVAAPAIDLLAPDIYLSGNDKILKVLDLYTSETNALFVPEISFGADRAKYLYAVLGSGGIGFSPFGIDDNNNGSTDMQKAEKLQPVGQEYAVLQPMMRQLARWSFEGKIAAVVQPEDGTSQRIDLGAWNAVVAFGTNNAATATVPALGKAMVVKLGVDSFLVVGTNSRLTFEPTGNNAGKAWQYLKVEEGNFEAGRFNLLRIRNGDETDFGGPRFGNKPAVLRVTIGLR